MQNLKRHIFSSQSILDDNMRFDVEKQMGSLVTANH